MRERASITWTKALKPRHEIGVCMRLDHRHVGVYVLGLKPVRLVTCFRPTDVCIFMEMIPRIARCDCWSIAAASGNAIGAGCQRIDVTWDYELCETLLLPWGDVPALFTYFSSLN